MHRVPKEKQMSCKLIKLFFFFFYIYKPFIRYFLRVVLFVIIKNCIIYEGKKKLVLQLIKERKSCNKNKRAKVLHFRL